jgi:Na+-transporting NADH:ubiquinone oxidoreductase subunit F
LTEKTNIISVNDDHSKTIYALPGHSLLSALTDNGIYLPSACGGRGICGTCKCAVKAGGGDVSPVELRHISETELEMNIRLACQINVKENLKINLPAEIFGIKKYGATVVSNENVTPFIKELIIKLDDGKNLIFKSGAYVQIDVPGYQVSFKEFSVADKYREEWDKINLWDLKAGSERPVFRAYSLANPPYEKKLLRFTVRIATPPSGKKEISPGISSSYIFNLKTGDKLTLTGPYGDFFIKDSDKEMCFIGGGAGMAPMRSHILNQLLAVKTKRKISFWYGARSKQDLFYEDEFRRLANEFDNFKFNIALSEPKPYDVWKGHTGFIHQCLLDNYLVSHKNTAGIEFYLCGPPLMINATLKMLESLGVKKDMIAYDKFG